MKYVFCFILASFLLFSCKSSNNSNSTSGEVQLGTVDFTVTGTEEGQQLFNKGLLLLHSFEYEDARAEFLKAQEADPSCIMACWGEAMTYNHTLWQRQELEDAREALNKIAPTAEERQAKAKTTIEKDFLKAVDILFAEGTKYERDVKYSDFLEQLRSKYPNNNEVSAFYAISLIGSSRNGRNDELYDKSAKIAQEIIQINPNHPGALHYLIHSYDDPDHAPLALAAADSYAKVAPDAAHALHMPSHIYVSLGKWNEVVKSNIASWNASVNRKEKKSLETDALSYHALNWLQYGMLQRGEFASAQSLLDKMKQYNEDKTTKVSRSYLLAMQGAQCVEEGKWNSSLQDAEMKIDDLGITKRAGYAFVEGMNYFKARDKDRLVNTIELLKKDVYKESLNVGEKGFSMCSAGGFASKPPSELDIDMAEIIVAQLDSRLALLNNEQDKAEKLLREASALDETLKYSFGPPIILQPVLEMYGEFLLDQGKTDLALETFDRSLERHPRRLRSFEGKMKAAEMLKDEAVVAAVSKELEISKEVMQRTEIL